MDEIKDLSFLPDDYLRRRHKRREYILCGAISAVVLAAIGSAYAISQRSMHGIEVRQSRIEQAYGDASRQIEQVRQMDLQEHNVVQQAELAASLVEKVPRSNILAEITNALPGGVSLIDFNLDTRERVQPVPAAGTSFEQKKAAAAVRQKAVSEPARPKVYDVYLKLTGVTDTDLQVSQFIAHLNSSPLFQDVNLIISASYQQGDQTLRRFQIEMTLNPDAEVRDEPARSAAIDPNLR